MRYLFRHVLMRDAVYGMQLGRRLREMHREAAESIEETYADDLAPHYADLAYHYGRTEDTDKELRYVRLAGERAVIWYATAEAVRFFSRALELTSEEDLPERYALTLAREKGYDLQGMREAQSQDLMALEHLAKVLSGDERQIETALRRANYAIMIGDYSAVVDAAQTAIRLARTGQMAHFEAMGHLYWGRALWYQGDYESARLRFEAALSLARVSRVHQVRANSLRALGNISWAQSDYASAEAYYKQALRIFREIDDRQAEGVVHNHLGIISAEQGDYAQAGDYHNQALRIWRQIGDRPGEAMSLGNLGIVSLYQGDYAGARTRFEQALAICRGVRHRRGESLILGYWSLLLHCLNDDRAALEYSQQALLVARELGDQPVQGDALTNLGHALTGSMRLAEANQAYQQAVALRRELGEHNRAMEPLVGLARVALTQGESVQAQAYVEEVLSHLETGTLAGTDEPFRIYLICYQVLAANYDPRAQDILTQAHTLLQDRAARIPDEATRRSFLENVAAHREIVALWQAMNEEKR